MHVEEAAETTMKRYEVWTIYCTVCTKCLTVYRMQKARKKGENVQSKQMFHLNMHCDRLSSLRMEIY